MFMDAIETIRQVAVKLHRVSNGEFEIDELVSEAWLKSSKKGHEDKPLTVKRAKLDMIDYIRSTIGRKEYESVLSSNRRYRTSRMITNWSVDWGAKEDKYSVAYFKWDRYAEATYDIDNKELIDKLLQGLKEKERAILTGVHLYGKTLKEAGEGIGIKPPYAYQLIKESREKCLRKAVKMGLDITCVSSS